MKVTALSELHEKGIHPYDPSMLSNFILCERSFYYRHERKLVRVDAEPRTALEFGSGCHKALQNWFPSRDEIMALQHFQKHFTPFEEKPQISKKTGKELAALYTLIFGSSLLLAYFQKHGPDNRKLVENEITIAEELIPGVYIMGVVDKILEGPRGLVFMDHKTTKYIDNFTLVPNLQFMTYKFLCQRLTGEKVTGELDVLGVSKTKEVDELLRREPFDYTDFQMQEWKTSVIWWAHCIDECRKCDYWPQAWNCNPYFKGCPYSPLCTSTREEQIEKLVQTMYTEKQWDPFMVV